MTDGKSVARVLGPGGALQVEGEAGAYLSLVPLCPVVTGVSVDNVHWPLTGATLRWGESLGVSNRLLGGEARVSVGEGYLLVVQAWD